MTFENIEVSHLRHALRGMRNPMSGWDKSDSLPISPYDDPAGGMPDGIPGLVGIDCDVGESDRKLAATLIRGGQPHRKFMRQISVIVDICKAPSYFWIELDTYKVGTVKDSSSTMHKITSRDLTEDDFEARETPLGRRQLVATLDLLNDTRRSYIIAKEQGDYKAAGQYFRDMKRMLPHDYLYERVTWSCSYENLIEIWRWRHNHRLPIWHQFCEEFIGETSVLGVYHAVPVFRADTGLVCTQLRGTHGDTHVRYT